MVESVDHVTGPRNDYLTTIVAGRNGAGSWSTSQIAAAKGTFRLAFSHRRLSPGHRLWRRPGNIGLPRPVALPIAAGRRCLSAIDGPTIGSNALKLIEAGRLHRFGMTGKICLSPDQCPVVNEAIPVAGQIVWAKEFFAEFARDGGGCNRSDLPRIARATKISITAYGIEGDFEGRTGFTCRLRHLPPLLGVSGEGAMPIRTSSSLTVRTRRGARMGVDCLSG